MIPHRDEFVDVFKRVNVLVQHAGQQYTGTFGITDQVNLLRTQSRLVGTRVHNMSERVPEHSSGGSGVK